ncbi:hypothetical protein A8B73_20060 [Methylosinus sp. 3S-1]|nr:hypothetical protein A8B73_20060 [Methylosinus sp. 3S-1]
MIEALIGEPDSMLLFPYRVGITTTMTEKEALDALPSLAQVLRRGLSSANEIAHGLMRFVWHPHRCELSGAGQARQHDSVASIGFDVIASAPRRVRRRDDFRAPNSG